MRNLNIVMAGCALAGGLFWAYTQWIAPTSSDNLGPFLAQVNDELLKAAAEGRGPGQVVITLVIGDPDAPKNPLMLAKRTGGFWGKILGEKNDGNFVAQIGEKGHMIGWLPTHPFDPGDRKQVAPFARILVKASNAGAIIRVLAQGEAVGFVATAAAIATEETGRPAVARLVGAGVRLGDIKARWPDAKNTFERQDVIGDRVLVWIDPEAVPRALQVESVGISFERNPGYATWQEILIRALDGGALSLKPLEQAESNANIVPRTRRFRDRTGRAFNKRMNKPSSGLDMLRQDGKPIEASTAAEAKPPMGDRHRIGKSGWSIAKIFRAASYLEPRGGGGMLWGSSPHMINVTTNAKGNQVGNMRTANDFCNERGKKPQPTKFEGSPAAICARFSMPEDSRPQAHHDVLTIFLQGAHINIKYTYDTLGDRESGLQKFHSVLSAIKKDK